MSDSITRIEAQLDLLEEEPAAISDADAVRLEDVINRLRVLTLFSALRVRIEREDNQAGRALISLNLSSQPEHEKPAAQKAREQHPDDYSFGVGGLHLG